MAIKISDDIVEAMKEEFDFEINGKIYNIYELQCESENRSSITIKFVRE